MTKQEFISGMYFTIKTPKISNGDCTYKFDNGIITKQIRSAVDNRVVLDDHECNVLKIGSKSFTGFTYVFNKRVNVKFNFEDLIPYKEVVGE